MARPAPVLSDPAVIAAFKKRDALAAATLEKTLARQLKTIITAAKDLTKSQAARLKAEGDKAGAKLLVSFGAELVAHLTESVAPAGSSEAA